MVLPDFLLIGAFRAGTTALHYYLQQHPAVFMSPLKEPNFFAIEGGVVEEQGFPWPGDQERLRELMTLENSVTTLERYAALFEQAPQGARIGEASPWYLYSPVAAARIQRTIPHVKLIAILRQPVERAYSHFVQHSRYGGEEGPSLEGALAEEAASIRAETGGFRHFLRMGLYAEHLRRYLDRFDRSQLRVYLYDELETNPQWMLRDLFNFLEIDPSFMPDVSLRYNSSGIPKSVVLDRVLGGMKPVKAIAKRMLPVGVVARMATVQNQIQNRNLGSKPELGAEERRRLTSLYYEKEILALQDLLGRDLNHWLA